MDRRARRYAIAALALLTATIALWAYIRYAAPLPYERRVAHWQRTAHTLPKWLTDTCQVFSSLGEPTPAIGLTALLVTVTAELRGRRAAGFVLASATVVVLNSALKHMLSPSILAREIGRRYDFVTHGFFPSGHTAFGTAVFGACAILAASARRPVIACWMAALAVLMGITRVVSSAHYPSDVLAGYLVGAAWLCLLLAFAPARVGAGAIRPGR